MAHIARLCRCMPSSGSVSTPFRVVSSASSVLRSPWSSASVSVSVSASASPLPLSLSLPLRRGMAQREQHNRDKENMKKKKEKAAEVKKKAGAMKDKAANMEAGDGVGVSVAAMEERIRDYLDNMKTAYAQIKAGRAVPAQLDDVIVNAHGQHVPLKAVGSISSRNATTLTIQLYDAGLVKEADKAIRLHNNNLNPQVEDGATLVVTFPKVTKEVRDELVKAVHKRSEETRAHLRNIRQEYLQQLKSLLAQKEISQDLNADLKGQIQVSHDVFVAQIKKLQEEKEKELQQV